MYIVIRKKIFVNFGADSGPKSLWRVQKLAKMTLDVFSIACKIKTKIIQIKKLSKLFKRANLKYSLKRLP